MSPSSSQSSLHLADPPQVAETEEQEIAPVLDNSQLPPSSAPPSLGVDSDQDQDQDQELPSASSHPPSPPPSFRPVSPPPPPPQQANRRTPFAPLPSFSPGVVLVPETEEPGPNSFMDSLMRKRPTIGQDPPPLSSGSGWKRSASSELPSLSKRRRQDTSPSPTPSEVENDAPYLDAPITTPYSSPEHPYKEFSLADDVHKADFLPYVQPCREAMRALGYPKEKSYNQAKAMWLVLSHESNLFLLLPTGFGKTALFQFIAKLRNDLQIGGRTVGGNVMVITPFTALLEGHVKSSRAKGIPTYNWQADRPAAVPPNTRILFIQPESFISQGFVS